MQRKIPNIDFLGKFPIAVFISVCIIAYSINLFLSKGEEKYGVDFTGGHEFLVRLAQNADSDVLRSKLAEAGREGAVVQGFEAGTNQFLVRLEGDETEALKAQVTSIIKSNFGDESQILREDFVGPTVGAELRTKALIAIAVSLLGILGFITFRFEFAFALGAVVALLHDVVVSTGIYLLAGQTFSMGAVAAALTIVGYSVNDTIVIFDRIREELAHSTKYNLTEVMNRCINLMLSRTLITHLLTFFTAGALYFYGGGAISDLSLYLLAGIVSGSYSTIYIACPIVILWHKMRGGTVEG